MASSMVVRASCGAARAAASAASRCPAAAAASSRVGSGGGGAGAASYWLLFLRGSPAAVASSPSRFGRACLSSYPNLDDDDNISCDSDEFSDLYCPYHVPGGDDLVDDDSADSESYPDDSDDGAERAKMFGRGSARFNLMQAAAVQGNPSPKTTRVQKKKASPNAVLDRSRAHWNAGLEKGLVELLHDHNNDYYRAQNGWSPDAWCRIVKLFYDKFPYVKITRTQIQTKVRQLKWEYRLLKQARKQSGASWDDKLCRIVADQSVWDNIITSHPSAKKFQNKSFPLFDALGELYDGQTAEGTLNFTSIAPSQVTQPSHAAQPPSQATVTQDYVGEEDEVFSFDSPAHNVETDDEDLRILEQPVVCDAAAKSRMGKRVATTRNKDNTTSDKTKNVAQRRRQDGQVVEMMERFIEMKEKQAEAEVAQQEKAKTNANEEFSIPVCISVVDKMEELSDDEKVLAYDVFKDAQNRSIFMSAKDSTRLKWLRKEITSHIRKSTQFKMPTFRCSVDVIFYKDPIVAHAA